MTDSQSDRGEAGKDYVTCLSCGFAGRVVRGCPRCPDCGFGVDPMTADERRGFDDGTFTHLEDHFDNLCGYTGLPSRARQEKLRGEK